MPTYFVTFKEGQKVTIKRKRFDHTRVAVIHTTSRLKAKALALQFFGPSFDEILVELPDGDLRKMIPLKTD